MRACMRGCVVARIYVCVRECVRECVGAWLREWVRACVCLCALLRACMRGCVKLQLWHCKGAQQGVSDMGKKRNGVMMTGSEAGPGYCKYDQGPRVKKYHGGGMK